MEDWLVLVCFCVDDAALFGCLLLRCWCVVAVGWSVSYVLSSLRGYECCNILPRQTTHFGPGLRAWECNSMENEQKEEKIAQAILGSNSIDPHRITFPHQKSRLASVV